MLSIISYLTRHLQLKGVPRLLWAAHPLLQKPEHIYQVGNGLRMRLDETQLYQWWYAVNYAGYEMALLNRRLLSPGDLVVDVGANIGYITLSAAKEVGPDGHVFAFEPSKRTHEHLLENIALNLATNVTCFPQALSNRTGEATFIVATDDGLSRLENRERNDFGLVMEERVRVKVDTLDNVWREHLGGRSVKLVKLDIEGQEMSALSGGEDFLKTACQYVISEINLPSLQQNGVGLSDLVGLMAGYGYESYWIHAHTADWLRFTRMPSLEKVREADYRKNISGEILFVKNERFREFAGACGDLICS